MTKCFVTSYLVKIFETSYKSLAKENTFIKQFSIKYLYNVIKYIFQKIYITINHAWKLRNSMFFSSKIVEKCKIMHFKLWY